VGRILCRQKGPHAEQCEFGRSERLGGKGNLARGGVSSVVRLIGFLRV
jgi:hypothetical protein